MERVVMQTADQVAVVGSWETDASAHQAVLLLHTMPADRTSWMEVQGALKQKGIASLAIDLRGHGESIVSAAGTLDYRAFTDADHRQTGEDGSAALRWLQVQWISSPHPF